jgi:hypothetical protein
MKAHGWLLMALLAAGCDVNAISGSGHVTTDRRTVSGFTAVELQGTGKLLVDQNGTEALTIEADDNLLSSLTSDITGGRLVLGTASGTHIRPSREIVYRVSARNLNGITLSGSGTVDVTGVNSDSLRLTLNGSGTISASGRADQQEISLNGSGDYQCANLKGKAVSVSIAGSGDGVVAASEKLDVTVMGSG